MKKLTLIITLLSVLVLANAQTDEKSILDSVTIRKNELIITPEIEKAVVTWLKNLPERAYSDYGIKNKSQLENLQIGKPIPYYAIVNEKQNPWSQCVNIYTVSRMSDGKPLFLEFRNNWSVPVRSNEEPLLFSMITFTDFGDPFINCGKNSSIIAHFHNYEYKDSLIGFVGMITPSDMREMDFLIIRKDNQVLFVEAYDKITGEYFKNEYSFSELINHIKELSLREKEERDRAQTKYSAYVADKSELIMTPKLTEMLVTQAYSGLINCDDYYLYHYGIKNRTQLENVYPGKPIPKYTIVNENLTFTGEWDVFAMLEGEPLFLTKIKLEDDGQYRWTGTFPFMVETIRNFEHKDLIIGSLKVNPKSGWDYLIIRKDNKVIFVKTYDEATLEYFKTEYSLSEVINLLKK